MIYPGITASTTHLKRKSPGESHHRCFIHLAWWHLPWDWLEIGVSLNLPVLELCSLNIWGFTFHKSSLQWQFTLKEITWVNKMCAGGSIGLLDKFYSITERTTYVNITEGEVSGGDLSQCWGIIQCSLNICILILIQYSSVVIAQEVTGSKHNAQRGLGGGQKVPKSKSYVRVPSQVNTALPQGGRQLLELRN